MSFLDELAARRRFGMKPGLETIRSLCAALGDPQMKFKAIHVAGTNGKGAVCAILDAALRNVRMNECSNVRMRIGRYTSPHLVRINERFFLGGAPVDDATLDRVASIVNRTIEQSNNRTFLNAASRIAHTAPFPFVPATWIALNFSCGSPSAAQRFRIVSSPGFIPKRRRAASSSRNFIWTSRRPRLPRPRIRR